MVGGVQSFLIDNRFLKKSFDLLSPKQEDVIFVVGGGNGQLPSFLSDSFRLIVVEPDPSIAHYLDSLSLRRTIVINSDPVLVIRDMAFDRIISLNPYLVDVSFLKSLLIVLVKKAVFFLPEYLLSFFRSRSMHAFLLRANYDVVVHQQVPSNAFSPRLKNKVFIVSLSEKSSGGGPVADSLRLLVREAGTVRGLLTRACRQFFGYSLAEAQEAVRLLPPQLLRKRFYEVSEDEFKEIYDWLKLG